jgi:endoglucanase
MKMINKKIIFWSPGAQCITLILFISFFSLAVFSEGYNIRKKIRSTSTDGKSASLSGIPFHRGVNLGNWFEEPRVGQININLYTEKDFRDIRSLGFDAVRIIIDLLHMAGPAPGYQLDPLFLEFLDKAVDQAEAAGLFIVLDNHTWDPVLNTDPAIEPVLLASWAQMAHRYKNRSAKVIYEVLNEPHGIADDVWSTMQGKAIQAIRAEDSFHIIVVGATNWNSYLNLAAMPVYADNNLMYTFHFYEPHVFTHQGNTWEDPSPRDLVGVPFPYDASTMPPLPASLVGTWWQTIYNAYPQQGNEAWIKSQLDIADQFQSARNVPLWCGEFGAFPPLPTTSRERAAWLRIVRTYLEEKGIAWNLHAFKDGFFERNTAGCIDTDVDTVITNALGLTPPVQTEPASEPETSGFMMYDDFIAPGLIECGWFGNGEFNLYSKDSPHNGASCLLITGFEQYGNISLRFCPYRDLSTLVARGYVLDLWTRCDSPGTQMNLTFKDTKTLDPDDHPWCKIFKLDSSTVKFDGQWHRVRIPLKNFTETGSWDNNQWYDGHGLFDWKALDQLSIVADYHSLAGIKLYLDDIKISAPDVNVTFRVAVPAQTPSTDTPYVAGSMNYWDPGPGQLGSDMANHDQPMNKIGQNLWEFTLSCTAGQTLEYKYTLGSWDKVEKDSQGEETSNRTFLVPYTNMVRLDTVKNWSDIASAIADNASDSYPTEYQLRQNYPNPFNPWTIIHYELPHGTYVELTVFNTQGQRMAILVQEFQDVGEHDVLFNGGSLAAGVYFYRLRTRDFEEMKKLILLR